MKLMEQVRNKIRYKQYSLRTEQAYAGWIKRYIFFHNKRHPSEMGASEIESFLTYLAVKRKVSASTQNLALCAILFLYRDVLEIELPWLDDFSPAKRPQRLPVVLSREEVQTLLDNVEKPLHTLVLRLLYGTGPLVPRHELLKCFTIFRYRPWEEAAGVRCARHGQSSPVGDHANTRCGMADG